MSDTEKSKNMQVVPARKTDLVLPSSGSIKSRMSVGALAIARQKVLAVSSTLYTVGSYQLHETDYRQLQVWANMLGSDVEAVMGRLSQLLYQTSNDGSIGLKIENGHIQSLVWDFDSFTLERLDFLEGLQIKTLCFLGSCPTARLHIFLSSLNGLYCDGIRIAKLDLSAVPNLTELYCLYT